MEQQEASRRAAQHALLAALRQFRSDPLIELRDALPALNPPEARAGSSSGSPERAARILEARERVQALGPAAAPLRVVEAAPAELEDPLVGVLDVEAWAERWRLHALRDLAPHLRAYWQKRPAAGTRFEFPPRILPLRLQSSIDLDPDRDSKDAFLARAEALYEEHLQALPVRPHHRRRQLMQHAKWYVRLHVQGWTADKIAQEATTAKESTDVSTIRKGVAEFARLLSTGRN